MRSLGSPETALNWLTSELEKRSGTGARLDCLTCLPSSGFTPNGSRSRAGIHTYFAQVWAFDLAANHRLGEEAQPAAKFEILVEEVCAKAGLSDGEIAIVDDLEEIQ